VLVCVALHLSISPTSAHFLLCVLLGTYFFFKNVCPERLDITTTPIDTSNQHALIEAIQKAPRLDALYLETPANPTLAVSDIAKCVSLAKNKNQDCLVFVDNTFLGPVFQAPFSHGADVVFYSATKFLSGHSDLLAGVALTKREDLTAKINGFRTILGPVVAPDVAWMLTRSLETLWLRMERQAEKATKIAKAVAAHPNVERVIFPGLSFGNNPNEESQAVWERQCTGTGSMISIVVRPNTREAAFKVLNGLDIAHLAVSLGSTETLVQHPRSMTHSDMSVEDLNTCGIVEGMLRISVGLENSSDITNDILSALDLLKNEEE